MGILKYSRTPKKSSKSFHAVWNNELKNISFDCLLNCWILLRSPAFAFLSHNQNKQKIFYLKLFPALVFHSLKILFKSLFSDIILSTHFISSPAFYQSCVSLFTHKFPFIQLIYQKDWITLIMKVVVSFGLQPENLLEEMLSCLTCVWSWTQGQRISRLTSKLHPVCKQTALHCISCHGESKLIVHLWIYSASQTATWYIQWDYILAQYACNCMDKTIQMAHRWHWNTSHWNLLYFKTLIRMSFSWNLLQFIYCSM